MSGHVHTLYHFNYSLWSTLTRYSIALGRRGKVLNELVVQERQIIIAPPKFDNLTEDYLCRINALGEVPVLERPDGTMIPDSMAITKYLAENYYPDLLPSAQQSRILELIDEIRGISVYAISMKGNPMAAQGQIKLLQARMEDETSSARYKEALAFKIKSVQDSKIPILGPEALQSMINRMEDLLKKLDALLKQSSTPYFLGLSSPSTLDAHVTVYCARILDLKRDELVPDSLKTYIEKARSSQEWQEVMQGRATVPPGMA